MAFGMLFERALAAHVDYRHCRRGLPDVSRHIPSGFYAAKPNVRNQTLKPDWFGITGSLDTKCNQGVRLR